MTRQHSQIFDKRVKQKMQDFLQKYVLYYTGGGAYSERLLKKVLTFLGKCAKITFTRVCKRRILILLTTFFALSKIDLLV